MEREIVRAAMRDLAADRTLPRHIVIRSRLLPGTACAITAEVAGQPGARAAPPAASHGVQTSLMDAIWPSNVSQADWLLDGLERAAGRPLVGLRVVLLGLTFKAGTDDQLQHAEPEADSTGWIGARHELTECFFRSAAE